jgi:UDP-glucose 6-dehydrogenase
MIPLTKAKLTKLIQTTVLEKRLTYIDAIVDICEENKIEIEDISKFLSPVIKEKIEVEAMNLNYLPKESTLNFD